jgi:protein CpxP
MNKSRLISIIAVGLLISNIALVCFIFFGHRGPAHEGPRDIIIERLHLDSKQTEEYDRLIFAHRRDMRQKQDEMLGLKQKLYNTLTNGDTITNNSLRQEIGNIQIDIENINYNHFRDIEKLCTPDQKIYFNDLIKDIAELFAPPRKPPGK